MEPRDRWSDPLDRLIVGALEENLGPPPDPQLWERIERELAQPPRRRVGSLLSTLVQSAVTSPITQSAVIVAVWLVLAMLPGVYWMSTPPTALDAHAPVVAPRVLGNQVLVDGEEQLARPLESPRIAVRAAPNPWFTTTALPSSSPQ